MTRFALILTVAASFSFLAFSTTATAGTGDRDRAAAAAAAKQLAAAPAGYRGWATTPRAARAGGRMSPNNYVSIGNPNCRNITNGSGYYCLISQYWTLPNWWTSEFAVFNWSNVIVGWIICYTGNSGYGQTSCYTR